MTWIDLLREKLPDSIYVKSQTIVPAQCPNTLLGGEAPGVNNRCEIVSAIDLSCWECWNSEVPEDERRK